VGKVGATKQTIVRDILQSAREERGVRNLENIGPLWVNPKNARENRARAEKNPLVQNSEPEDGANEWGGNRLGKPYRNERLRRN